MVTYVIILWGGGIIFILARVLLLHDLYNLLDTMLLVFFFTLKIHVRKYLMTARDRLEIWSINADSSIKSAINLYG